MVAILDIETERFYKIVSHLASMILQIMFQFNPNYGSGEDVKS